MTNSETSIGNGRDASIGEGLKSNLFSRQSLADVEQRAQSFVRERPVAAVLTAVAIGYCLARLARRS